MASTFGMIIENLGWIARGLKSEVPVLSTTARAGAILSKAHMGDRILIGAVGGAALNVGFGDKDKPVLERLKSGVLYGAGLGAFTSIAAVGAGTAGEVAYRGLKAGIPATGKGLYRYAGSRVSMFKSGASAMKAFGTYPAFMAAGAVAGATLDQDDRLHGAMYGALGGLGLKAGFTTYDMYKNTNTLGKVGMIVGGSVAAAGITASMQGPGTAAVAPDYAEAYNGGVNNRMRSMNASGDLVLGSHRRRH